MTELTEFQQQLMDAAEEWVSQALNANKQDIDDDDFGKTEQAAFRALVKRAVDVDNIVISVAKSSANAATLITTYKEIE